MRRLHLSSVVFVACVVLVGSAWAQDAPFPPEPSLSEDDVLVPLCLTGTVSELEGPGYCMDGATHQLESVALPAPIRVKAGSQKVQEAIRRYTSSGATVTACGYLRESAEEGCAYLEAYAVLEPGDFMARTNRGFSEVAEAEEDRQEDPGGREEQAGNGG